MVTVYPLLGEPYQITDAEEAELERRNKLDPAHQGRVARAEEERRNAELTDALIDEGMAARLKKEAETAHAAELQPHLDQIDAIFGRVLKNELAAENATSRVTTQQRKDFAMFKASAEKWELPYLPAAPQMVVLFLAEQSDRGLKYVTRLCRSIAAVHKACNFPDVTNDPLVRGVLRCLRTDKANQKGLENGQ